MSLTLYACSVSLNLRGRSALITHSYPALSKGECRHTHSYSHTHIWILRGQIWAKENTFSHTWHLLSPCCTRKSILLEWSLEHTSHTIHLMDRDFTWVSTQSFPPSPTTTKCWRGGRGKGEKSSTLEPLVLVVLVLALVVLVHTLSLWTTAITCVSEWKGFFFNPLADPLYYSPSNCFLPVLWQLLCDQVTGKGHESDLLSPLVHREEKVHETHTNSLTLGDPWDWVSPFICLIARTVTRSWVKSQVATHCSSRDWGCS